jgi:hypothetical protein
MPQNTPDPLSHEKFKTLREIGSGIPSAHRERLIRLGYVKELLGNLILTEDGLTRISLGNNRLARLVA